MATQMITKNYTLNNVEALKVANLSIKKIKPTHVKHEFMMSKKERIVQAGNVLDLNK